ncbi:MAG TPA: SEC-C metal-binding domain-containing protein [Thermoanaerobaculia bacterium]|nr:SEC-C metal-binding domain-containing protein [Thermoanaerobaculia bacterium]
MRPHRRLPWGYASGRNDPCPCGTGLKYKRCCLDADRTPARLISAAAAAWRRGAAGWGRQRRDDALRRDTHRFADPQRAES